MYKKIFIVFLFALMLMPLLAESTFYVKQERVQLPGRKLQIRVQGINGELSLTIFRIKNPSLFLSNQRDIHKLRIEDTPIRELLNRAIELSSLPNKPKIYGKIKKAQQLNFEYCLYTKVKVNKQKSFDGYTPVILDVKLPGLYLIEALQGNRITYCLASCSDLAMIIRRSSKRILVYTVDRKKGTPRAAVNIDVYRGNKLVCQGKTDKTGIFYPAQLNYSPQLKVMATDNENFTANDPIFFPSIVDSNKGYIFTERPLYLPGEKVFFKGILRKWTANGYELPAIAKTSLTYSVFDARGKKIKQDKLLLNSQAAFAGEFVLPKTVSLGGFKIIATAMNCKFQSEFRVEKFQKPKFMVRVKPRKKAVVMGEKLYFDISASYYAGGKLNKGNVSYRLYRSRFNQPLFKDAGLASFYSQNEYQSFKSELIKSGSAKLTKDGCLLSFPTAQSKFNYYYRLQATIVDPSRNVAGGSSSVEVAQAAIKMDIQTNKELFAVEEQIEVLVKAIDLQGRPVETDFVVEFTRRGRQYPKGGSAGRLPWEIRELDRGPEIAAKKYITVRGRTNKMGITRVESPALLPGEIDIFVHAIDPNKNKIVCEKSVWVGQGSEPVLYSGRSIQLVPDKKAYRVGEIANVLVILPMSKVTPLITFEGAEILQYQLRSFPNNAWMLKVPITEQMSPNVYIRAGAIYRNGLVEAQKMLVVPPLHKMLKVTISADRKKYGPGQQATFTITAHDYKGAPVETDFAMSVVDASLYALASDQNAPLHRFFYPLRRSNIGSASSILMLSYDYSRKTSRVPIAVPEPKPVLKKRIAMRSRRERNGAGAGVVADDEDSATEAPRPVEAADPASVPRPSASPEPRRLARAAPSMPKKKGKVKAPSMPKTSERKLFKTTAAWFAFVRTDANGQAQVSCRFPDNLTNWQITLRAIDEYTRIAQLQCKASTRKPVMVMLNHPMFVVEKDRIRLELAARNATSSRQALTLQLHSTNKLKLQKPVQIKQDVASGAWLRSGAWFDAVASGQEVLSSSAVGRHSDALRSKINVIAHGIRQSRGASGILNNEISKLDSSLFALPKNYRADSAKLTVRLYPGYVCAIRDSLKMLIAYPYGCTEQTMSRFMPNLVASQVFRNLNIATAIGPQQNEHYIHAGLARLVQLQHADGGWGWWKNDNSQPMISAYVMAGLGRAHALKYNISQDMRSKGVDFLRGTIQKADLDYPTKAYILYALALNGALTPSIGDRVFDQQQRLQADAYTLSLLVLAMNKIGRKAETKVLIKQIEKLAKGGEELPHWGQISARRWHKNAVEVTAIVARALLDYNTKHPLITPALRWLMTQKKDHGWYSTKDTAEVILTLCSYLQKHKSTNTYSDFITVRLNNFVRKIRITKEIKSIVFPAAALQMGHNQLSFVCDTPGKVFYSAYLNYFTTELPISANDAGLKIERNYSVLSPVKQGKQLVYQQAKLPKTLKPGQLIMVNLKVKVAQKRDFVMVCDFLPATAKVERNDRNITLARPFKTTPWVHREFHQSKAVFFFTQLPAGEHQVRYFFRPVFAGRFHALPAIASLMYYPEISGNSREQIIEVK